MIDQEEAAETESNEPPEIEGDVPKPAFEEPAEAPKPEPQAARNGNGAPNNRGPRAERRREYDGKLNGWREEATRAQSEVQRLREEFARFRGEQEALQRQNQTDPVQAKLADNKKRIEAALDRMGRGDNTAMEDWHAARMEEQRIIARNEAETFAKENAKNAPKPLDPILQAVTAKHDWLLTDHDARQIAEGVIARLVRTERRDMSDPGVRRQTMLQAAAEVARDLHLGDPGNTEPSDVQRERYHGVSGKTTGAGEGKTVVSMTSDQKAQAEALFKYMEPDAAHKEWWLKVGKKIAERSK